MHACVCVCLCVGVCMYVYRNIDLLPKYICIHPSFYLFTDLFFLFLFYLGGGGGGGGVICLFYVFTVSCIS